MKTMRAVLLGAVLLGPATVSNAGMVTLFDVNFSTPPHTLGEAPATGLGPSTPSLAIFQPAHVQDDVGNLALEFGIDVAPDDPNDISRTSSLLLFALDAGAQRYSIGFDVNAVNLADAGDSFSVAFGTFAEAQGFQIDGSGNVSLDPFSGPDASGRMSIGTLPQGQFSRFQFDVDLVARQFDVFQDGMLLVDSADFAPAGDLEVLSIGFTTINPDSSVVLDNVLVTAQVPEPAVLGLLSLAGLGLALRGSRRRG